MRPNDLRFLSMSIIVWDCMSGVFHIAASACLPPRPGDNGTVQVKAIGAALIWCVTFGDD